MMGGQQTPVAQLSSTQAKNAKKVTFRPQEDYEKTIPKTSDQDYAIHVDQQEFDKYLKAYQAKIMQEQFYQNHFIATRCSSF